VCLLALPLVGLIRPLHVPSLASCSRTLLRDVAARPYQLGVPSAAVYQAAQPRVKPIVRRLSTPICPAASVHRLLWILWISRPPYHGPPIPALLPVDRPISPDALSAPFQPFPWRRPPDPPQKALQNHTIFDLILPQALIMRRKQRNIRLKPSRKKSISPISTENQVYAAFTFHLSARFAQVWIYLWTNLPSCLQTAGIHACNDHDSHTPTGPKHCSYRARSPEQPVEKPPFPGYNGRGISTRFR